MIKWTAENIPDQTGKTAVVTGANSGLGYHTALELGRAGARVVLGVRDQRKGEVAIRRLQAQLPDARLHVRQVDLADLRSIHRFAERLLHISGPPDILVNNAGVMGVPQRLVTADEFELQFGTNHLGHFALTGLLLPGMLTRPQARVVTVSSLAHVHGRISFDDLQGKRVYEPWAAYSQSKLANLLFAFELDRRARAHGLDLISVAVHPGVSVTNLQTTGPRLGQLSLVTRARLSLVRLIGQSAARGAWPSLYAATAPGVVGGAFYGPSGPGQIHGHPTRVQPSPRSLDEQLAGWLWDVSERLAGVRFRWEDAATALADRTSSHASPDPAEHAHEGPLGQPERTPLGGGVRRTTHLRAPG